MTPARHSSTSRWSYGTPAAGDDLSTLHVSREERIGAPVSSAMRTAIRRLAGLAIVVGLGWLVIENRETAAAWLAQARSATAALMETAGRTGKAETAAREPKPGALMPLVEADTGKVEAAAPASEVTTGSLARIGKPYEEPAAETPADKDALDALQRRAEAVGLHPGLSRVLLARLSAVDFRNAQIAIDTALTQTPDDSEHTFPKTRDAGLALFRVHFVAGAGDSCRRYVVTIAKDGWLTTALPMEKCGVKLRSARKE